MNSVRLIVNYLNEQKGGSGLDTKLAVHRVSGKINL